jgi:hypothetical protein
MPVQPLTQVDPTQFFNLPSTTGAGTQRLDTKVGAISASNDLTGRLMVTTAEGDRITLTADLEARFQAVSYQAHARTENGTVDVTATSIEASLKQKYGVTVEGDLNEQEVHDLEKLFRKVAKIFRKFFRGQDEEALAKTAKLAERFGSLSSLTGLDLSVDVERSVTVLAAQVASEVTGQPALPTSQQTPAASTATPGGAPATAAEIPQPSTGTTAPTPPSTAAAVSGTADEAHLSAPAQAPQPAVSLVQQFLDALKASKVESHKVRKHLPDFFKKLREDLVKELRGERERESDDHNQPANQVLTPATTNASVVFAYQSVRQTSVSLSIRS